MEPFIGQIQPFGFNFAPRGWALCNGQLLPINQNSALFSLLGTIYGGDGRTTFQLPDLRGRVSFNFGSGPGLPTYNIGAKGGNVDTVLTTANMPNHTHKLRAANVAGDDTNPTTGNGFGIAGDDLYIETAPSTHMGTNTVESVGGNQQFSNRSPYLTINYCIALTGIFPSRN